MKIGFILNSQFEVSSVFQGITSEAEAAVSYLAIELAKLGHNITVFSQSTNNSNEFDVRVRNINISNHTLNLDKAILEADFDALIIKNNSPEFLVSLKTALPYKPKMYLWTAFDYIDPINQGLNNPEIIAEIEGIICVSEWQRTRLAGKFNIPRNKINVKLYAIAYFFENLFVDGKELIKTKSNQPLLAYTAKDTDCIEYLREAFNDVHNNYPTAKLNIFTNATPALSPEHLATQLRTYNILTYPSTKEMTSCTPIMEAMAAGLYVITSNSGALPEYCDEHGKCIKQQNLHTGTLDSFTGQLLAVCQTQAHSPNTFYDYCFKQTIDINKHHTWRVRAREWLEMLNAPDTF